MNDKASLRRWLLALAATTILTAACVIWVDRPAAEFFDRHFPQAEWRLWIDRLVAPFEAGVLAALVFLIACGGSYVGHGGRHHLQTPLRSRLGRPHLSR
jgi:hypothetical protein